jgi:hypothetical protein
MSNLTWRRQHGNWGPRDQTDYAVVDMSGDRCRCGLRLPCNGCLPSIEEVAYSRPGGGETVPDGGGIEPTPVDVVKERARWRAAKARSRFRRGRVTRSDK